MNRETKKWRRPTVPLASLTLVLTTLAVGCGGGGGSSSSSGGGSSPPPPIIVSVSPSSANVPFQGVAQFTATVTGTSNTAVTWSVSAPGISPVVGGNAQLGTITSSGVYTAPSPTPLPNPLATAPTSFSVAAGGTNCNFSQPSSCAGGSIVSVGTLNLTPQISSTTVTVTATSQADSTKSASATLTIASLSLFAVGICPCLGCTCTAGSTGVEVTAGSSPTLFVVGEGIVSGTTFTVSHPSNVTDVNVIPTTVQYCATKGTPAYPCATFQISVLPDAAVGPRNLMVTDSAGELAAFPGGIRICPATGCTQ